MQVFIAAVVVVFTTFILQSVWNWHAYLFTDTKLTFWQAAGTYCLLRVLFGFKLPSNKDERTPTERMNDFGYLILAEIMIYITAWLAHVLQ